MIQKTKGSIQWVNYHIKKFSALKHYNHTGVHLIADFWGGKIIGDAEKIKEILIKASLRANNTPLRVAVHKFEPQGITGIILLAESHIAIHDWPEFNYMAVDIYTCGDKSEPPKALEYLKEAFQPKKVEIREIKRGKIK